MSVRWAVIKNAYTAYNISTFPLLLLFMAILYLVIKDKKEQRNLLIYEIFGILLLVTPFIANKIMTFGIEVEENWSAYGILCAVAVTAYTLTEIISESEKKSTRFLLFAATLVIVQTGMGFALTNEQFRFGDKSEVVAQMLCHTYKSVWAAGQII